MDLEAILARKPKLVLVDEFAHTNAPGSRHPKRYQDVVELLDAGIDVYTTLNVQHIESRADAVRQITGATVHETVPDSVFGLADQIELVDITPEALRERLRRGRSTWRAAPPRRPRTSSRTRTSRRCASWRCASSPSMSTSACASCARWAPSRRSGARASGSSWRWAEPLLHPARPLDAADGGLAGRLLDRRQRRDLAAAGWGGAAPPRERTCRWPASWAPRSSSPTTTDVAEALVRVALQNNATQIVVGKSRSPRWLDALRGGQPGRPAAADRRAIDIYVVPAERAAEKPTTWIDWRPASARPHASTARSSASSPPSPWRAGSSSRIRGTSRSASFYLLAVIILSLRVGPGPVLVAGVLSALVWDYLFIPPIFTFVIGEVGGRLHVRHLLCRRAHLGQLTARVRAQERNERMREDRATALFHLTQAISSARTLDDAVFAALRQADVLSAPRPRSSSTTATGRPSCPISPAPS
jgi:two-component system, OmpR family, sensor histidine kinase KdpD